MAYQQFETYVDEQLEQLHEKIDAIMQHFKIELDQDDWDETANEDETILDEEAIIN